MFIAQFFTLALLIVFITTMMLLGWPSQLLIAFFSILFIMKFISYIINTINNT